MYSVFAELLRIKNLKVSDVQRGTGINFSAFSDWKAGRSVLKADKLLLVAQFLGVSLEYLLTGQETKPNTNAPYLSDPILREYMKKIWTLPKERQDKIFEMIEAQIMFNERDLDEQRKKEEALG